MTICLELWQLAAFVTAVSIFMMLAGVIAGIAMGSIRR